MHSESTGCASMVTQHVKGVTEIQSSLIPMPGGKEGEGSLLGGFLSAQPVLWLIHSGTQRTFTGHDIDWGCQVNDTRGAPAPPKLMAETGDITP